MLIFKHNSPTHFLRLNSLKKGLKNLKKVPKLKTFKKKQFLKENLKTLVRKKKPYKIYTILILILILELCSKPQSDNCLIIYEVHK